MATVDITVMGAGVFGLSVAYACALRGARVQVIDPAGVGGGGQWRHRRCIGPACAGKLVGQEGVSTGQPADGG